MIFGQPKIYLWKNSGLSSLANEDENSYHEVIYPTRGRSCKQNSGKFCVAFQLCFVVETVKQPTYLYKVRKILSSHQNIF